MGFLQNLIPNALSGLGEKVKNGVKNGIEWFGKAKGLYETGKAIYNGFQTILPYIQDAAAALPYVI